ncbi:hypothetical protein [Francisella marina]|uniref:hypothetical protein n=1 Tax=Francisella marina TaxID=2249302 RepID=UPI0011ED8126|nr:hypothetical protein [Francisella marina]QEO58304.1 hypothetical protein F0R75_00405 [Francisella marina]
MDKYEFCRLHGAITSASRSYDCGVEDAKHFTPKKRIFQRVKTIEYLCSKCHKRKISKEIK